MDATNEAIMEELKRMMTILGQMNKEQFAVQYLDMDELCSILKISRKTAFTWRKDKILPSIILGRRVYFRNKDIENLFEEEFKLQNPILKRKAKERKFKFMESGNGWDLNVYGSEDIGEELPARYGSKKTKRNKKLKR